MFSPNGPCFLDENEDPVAKNFETDVEIARSHNSTMSFPQKNAAIWTEQLLESICPYEIRIGFNLFFGRLQ